MARRLAAQDAALVLEHREHVAVADLGAQELDAEVAQRELEPQVAHDRADDGAAQAARLAAVARENVDELIAVDEIAALVDHDDAIAVAVEREADVRPHAGDRELQQIGSRRPAAVVDVAAVRRAADRHDVGAEIGHDARSDFVRSAVRRIDDDLEVLEAHARGNRGLAELHVVGARGRARSSLDRARASRA